MQQDWKEICAQKRQSIDALLPARWKLPSDAVPSDVKDVTQIPRQFLNEREIEITERYSATALAAALASGALSAVEVTEAFCHRATIAHQLVRRTLSFPHGIFGMMEC